MRSVAVLTGTGVLSQLVGFLYRILLTRLAGAEILGLYQLILPLYSVLLSLTGVGLYTAVSNLSARYQALGNRRGIYQLRGVALRLFFLLAVLPGAALLVFSDAASVYLLGDARTRLGLMLLVPCLLLTGTENLHKHYFYGTGRVYPAAITELLEQVVRAAFILALLVVLRPGTAEGAVGVIVLGMVCSEVLAAITQLLLFRLSLGAPGKLTGERLQPAALQRQVLHIALPLGGAALLGNLISSANAVLIPRLLVQGGMEQSQAVSAYGVTFGMTLPMLLLPTAFLSALGLVLTPKLSEYSALGRQEEIRRQVRRSVGASNLILIPALALLAVLGSAIGEALYGQAGVGDHLPLLALGVLFSCWQTLFLCVLNGLNRQGSSAAIALVCDGVQLLLTCLLVGRLGMGGYALGFVLSSLLGAVLSWLVAAQATGLQLPVFSWFTAPTLAACLAAACGELMETVLLRSGLGTFPAACGALVFGLLLYLAALQAMGVGKGRWS
ncbi:MAG: oligosaccharide flippase family protein [Ruminiclostridium sp.]|nr:oligosaccharide flippase family protein [Ruminiclostridium sp.]MCI9467448.1 oligosaccharide flippase family protein [Ruminiclostridium sp.]